MIEKLKELAAANGITEGLRVYLSEDYQSVEGVGLHGWELISYGGGYEMKYEQRILLRKEDVNG